MKAKPAFLVIPWMQSATETSRSSSEALVKVAVVTFPGSNCDEDALHVVNDVLGASGELVWHGSQELPEGTDLVILPG